MVTVHRPFGDRKVIESFVRSTSGHHSALFYDLVRLSEKAGLSLKEEQKDILDTISTFNLQADMMIIKCHFTGNARENLQKGGLMKSRISGNG